MNANLAVFDVSSTIFVRVVMTILPWRVTHMRSQFRDEEDKGTYTYIKLF